MRTLLCRTGPEPRRDGITKLQLETFLRIVQVGSFSDAALTLDVSQPTVSGRIRSLEQAVGGELFVRRGGRVRLTPQGEAFRRHALEAVEALDAGLVAARQGEQQSGRLLLGVS